MVMTSRSITELASIIADNTRILDAYFIQQGLPTPSFDIAGPTRVAIPGDAFPEVAAAHLAVLDATQQLHHLVKGPMGVLMGISAHDVLSLQAIYRYKLAAAIPVGEERSFQDLADATGLNLVDLRRLLRHAMCNHIFCEPRAGVVAHTAASRLLAENPIVRDFVGIAVDERFPGEARTMDAIAANGGVHDPQTCGFALGHNTNKGLYEEMVAHPARGQRWAGAMSAMAATISIEPLLQAIDWASFGEATIVDVGGGWGPVSIGIANRFPELDFVLQDLPETIEEAKSHIPAEVKDRIRFMPHDLLQPQPVKDAAVYYFRAIFHNWPDQYCVRILKSLVPALKPGARIIIDDNVLHEPNSLPPPTDRRRRSMDLNMLTFFGSRERYIADYEAIIGDADPRFHLRGVLQPIPNLYFILDIEWKG